MPPFKISQRFTDPPKLFFSKVGFHAVDQRGRDNDPAGIMGHPMVKNAKPRTMRVLHIKNHPRVITDITILSYIAPDFLNNLRWELPGFHTKSESGTNRAVDRKLGRNRLAANAASLLTYGDDGDWFDIRRLPENNKKIKSKHLF